MSNTGDLSRNTIFQLKEMLAREKTLLLNSRFLEKLPDKGAKLKDKAEKIKKELLSRELAAMSLVESEKKRSEIEKLEWNLTTLITSSEINQNNSSNSKCTIDSEDESDVEGYVKEPDFDGTNDEEMTLKMLATSQISQNQPKSTIPDDIRKPKSIKLGEDCPLYIKMLANTLEHKSLKSRFVPNRPKNLSPSSVTNVNPRSPNCSDSSFDSCCSPSDNKVGKKAMKWDASLLPSKNLFGTVQSLSLDESLRLNTEQSGRLEDLNQKPKSRKVYAYESLLESATFGTASLELRPPKSSISQNDDEIEDLYESEDLSDDDDDDEDEDEDSSADESGGGKRIKNLSELVNAILKIQ